MSMDFLAFNQSFHVGTGLKERRISIGVDCNADLIQNMQSSDCLFQSAIPGQCEKVFTTDGYTRTTVVAL
eukprot:Gb_04031 [translate_table: standard]